MDNFKLYQYLINAYNISPYIYANNYLESTSTVNNNQALYALNENYQLSEDILLKLLFSKYIYDKELNNDNNTYTNFILRSDKNYINYYENENFIYNTYYFEDNMKVLNINDESAKPYMNDKIIDFDMTKYASDKVRCYLFYLDIISQIYAFIYDLKKNKQSININQIVLKSRYISNGNNSLVLYVTQNANGTFQLRLKIRRSNTDVLEGTDCFGDRPICNIYEIFKKDIERHLNYISGDDIKYTGILYLKTVEYFYKLCRLKLSYMIAHSIYLLPYTQRSQ